MLNVTYKPLMLSVVTECHYAKCHLQAMLSVVMLNVVRLSVVAPKHVASDWLLVYNYVLKALA